MDVPLSKDHARLQEIDTYLIKKNQPNTEHEWLNNKISVCCDFLKWIHTYNIIKIDKKMAK